MALEAQKYSWFQNGGSNDDKLYCFFRNNFYLSLPITDNYTFVDQFPLQDWRRVLLNVQQRTGIVCDTAAAKQSAQHSVDRTGVADELVGQYIRKTIAVFNECGAVNEAAAKE